MHKRMRKYPRVQSRVLIFLALYGPSSPYDVAREEDLCRSSVSKALEALKRDGRVLVARKSRARSGVRKRIYKISIHSLIEVLRGCKDVDTARAIIYRNAERLPFVFGKWDLFRKRGVEDLAFRILRGFSWAGWTGEPFKNKPGTRGYEEEYAEYFQYSFFLLAHDLLSREEFDKWMSVITADDDICRFFHEQLAKEKEVYMSRARELEELERLLAQTLNDP